uniref:Uncharacterized protein n=1 Tax=Mycena chlorophos TaxID=658473 RepID=A0ABQ0LR65_MYCCL|nr:predicted protein [Mycena chlorophos]
MRAPARVRESCAAHFAELEADRRHQLYVVLASHHIHVRGVGTHDEPIRHTNTPRVTLEPEITHSPSRSTTCREAPLPAQHRTCSWHHCPLRAWYRQETVLVHVGFGSTTVVRQSTSLSLEPRERRVAVLANANVANGPAASFAALEFGAVNAARPGTTVSVAVSSSPAEHALCLYRLVPSAVGPAELGGHVGWPEIGRRTARRGVLWISSNSPYSRRQATVPSRDKDNGAGRLLRAHPSHPRHHHASGRLRLCAFGASPSGSSTGYHQEKVDTAATSISRTTMERRIRCPLLTPCWPRRSSTGTTV